MSDAEFSSYTHIENGITRKIEVDFSNMSAQDISGMYADVWGTDYKEEDNMLEWRVIEPNIWEIICEKSKIATVRYVDFRYLATLELDDVEEKTIKFMYEFQVDIYLKKGYLAWTTRKLDEDEELQEWLNTDEALAASMAEWDRMNTLRSVDVVCLDCGRRDDLHWFWCVKICRKCTHPSIDMHWYWCEEFTTDEDECDDSCDSGCVKCQAPRDMYNHKNLIITKLHKFLYVSNPERMLECEWACSMNSRTGCNYPDCLPVEKPKIRNLQESQTVIWCTSCNGWEHARTDVFGHRSCKRCYTPLDKMELYL